MALWQEIAIQGFSEALASESLDRAHAYIGRPAFIGGIEVEQLTPYRVEWLKALRNPYAVGGDISLAPVLQFIWVCRKEFSTEDGALKKFIETVGIIDETEAREDIEDYLDKAYLDAPDGAETMPYYSGLSALQYQMRKEYGWDTERTKHEPLRVIFQLLKVVAHFNAQTVTNRRSQKVSGDWLAAQNTPEAIAARRKAAQKPVKKKREARHVRK